MACVNPQSMDYSPAFEPWPAQARRGRRPALIPANCSLTQSEAEELVRTRIQQPLIPPPDAILEHIQPTSQPRSLTNWFYRTKSASAEAPPPPHSDDAIPLRPLYGFHEYGMSKARAQSLPSTSTVTPFSIFDFNSSAQGGQRVRKRSEFVVEEEREVKARADTRHVSELLPGDDDDSDDVREDPRLNMRYHFGRTTRRPPSVTSNPDEEKESRTKKQDDCDLGSDLVQEAV